MDSPQERDHLLDEEEKSSLRSFSTGPFESSRGHSSLQSKCVCVILGVFFVLNLVLGALLAQAHLPGHHGRTPYAGLTRSKEFPWTHRSAYFSHNRSESDGVWDAISFDEGIIAISDDEAASMGLPKSQRFPWDDSKGIYLVNGYHNLHCLKELWRSLSRYRDGVPFDSPDLHAFHCIDSLRQDVLCDADDTPRQSGEPHITGAGQQHRCRDWTMLQSWVTEHSACYRFLNEGHVEDTLDLYKFCPEGSPYNRRINQLFGDEDRMRMKDLYGEAGRY